MLPILEQALAEATHNAEKAPRRSEESELANRDLIRRLLALPPEKRTNFLRKRVGICQSCL